MPVRSSVQLHPWVRMRAKGWWPGDMHVHRPSEDAAGIARGEDLNFMVLVNRGKQDLFRADHWPQAPETQLADGYWAALRNAEDERRGGSWILNGLKAPLKLGREGSWFPPGLNYVRAARSQRAPGEVLPWFDIDMPFWWEVPVMVARRRRTRSIFCTTSSCNTASTKANTGASRATGGNSPAA